MTWTTEKPTKPGEYEVSLEPSLRGTGKAVHAVSVWASVSDGGLCVGWYGANFELSAPRFLGAMWRLRETSADPFAEPNPSPLSPPWRVELERLKFITESGHLGPNTVGAAKHDRLALLANLRRLVVDGGHEAHCPVAVLRAASVITPPAWIEKPPTAKRAENTGIDVSGSGWRIWLETERVLAAIDAAGAAVLAGEG